MIADARDARDQVEGLLFEGRLDEAFEVAQTLTVLGDDAEFESFMQTVLGAADKRQLHVAGDYPERVVDRLKVNLTKAQHAHLCEKVNELRAMRLSNNQVLAYTR